MEGQCLTHTLFLSIVVDGRDRPYRCYTKTWGVLHATLLRNGSAMDVASNLGVHPTVSCEKVVGPTSCTHSQYIQGFHCSSRLLWCSISMLYTAKLLRILLCGYFRARTNSGFDSMFCTYFRYVLYSKYFVFQYYHWWHMFSPVVSSFRTAHTLSILSVGWLSRYIYWPPVLL